MCVIWYSDSIYLVGCMKTAECAVITAVVLAALAVAEAALTTPNVTKSDFAYRESLISLKGLTVPGAGVGGGDVVMFVGGMCARPVWNGYTYVDQFVGLSDVMWIDVRANTFLYTPGAVAPTRQMTPGPYIPLASERNQTVNGTLSVPRAVSAAVIVSVNASANAPARLLAIFAGGFVRQAVTSAAVDIFDITHQTWTNVSLSQSRTNIAGAVSCDGRYVLFAGGQIITPFGGGGSYAADTVRTVDYYDTISGVWGVMHLPLIMSNGVGSCIGDLVVFMVDGWRQPNAFIWNTVSRVWSVPFDPSNGVAFPSPIATALIDSKVVVVGMGTTRNGMWTYDATTNVWAGMDQDYTVSIELGVIGRRVYYWGDQPGEGGRVVVLNTDSQQWGIISDLPSLFATYGACGTGVLAFDGPQSVWIGSGGCGPAPSDNTSFVFVRGMELMDVAWYERPDSGSNSPAATITILVLIPLIGGCFTIIACVLLVRWSTGRDEARRGSRAEFVCCVVL